jgi:hypothetical protein
MRATLRTLLAGAAAGAAGTTALNAVTYLDMAVRGRSASSTPQDTVAELSRRSGVGVPGDESTRENRLEGLGALSGIAAGVATGVLTGVLLATSRVAGASPGYRSTFVTTAALVLVAGNGPMTALGITDPRTWDAEAWASDLAPHLAYAAVAAYVLTGLTPHPTPHPTPHHSAPSP